MNEIEEKLLAFRLPYWDELPDVELYMDQLVSYAERHLDAINIGQEGKLITASMINNYVKMKLIPAPVKKKYGVKQVARLLVIGSLKRDFSISELQNMMEIVLMRFENRVAYDLYCKEMERTIRHAFTGEPLPPTGDTPEEAMIRAVMTAFANKLYAHTIILTSASALKHEGILPIAGAV